LRRWSFPAGRSRRLASSRSACSRKHGARFRKPGYRGTARHRRYSEGAASAPTLSITSAALATAAYAIPAAILLLLTFLALARLFTCAPAPTSCRRPLAQRACACQRRMGFKHGTALLTSDDLASPISWGLMRPVILLNRRAVEASSEAEAIIAHELAHVARWTG
jgi:beta-lactamase regulating signal transducer with metallopeptidase domain